MPIFLHCFVTPERHTTTMAAATAPERTETLPGMGAYRVKFKGLSKIDSLDEEVTPTIGDEVTYTVVTKCSEEGDILMKDGELRHVCGMDVVSILPQGPPAKPTGEPDLFTTADVGDDD
jgi:hypothetical protein